METSLERSIEILERTPRALRALLEGLPADWTQGRYGPGTWCAHEVVGHMIVCERVDWMVRVRRILEQGERVPFDPVGHEATIGPETAALGALLDEFANVRATNLEELRGLKLLPSDLSRAGTHPALGRVTLGQLLATWTVHDLHHLRQISLAMAWQYREAVGPWKAYLNTLARP